MRTIRTPKKRTVFINALCEGWSVRGACDKARMARSAAYRWREEEPEFAAEWDAAIEEGTDVLEDEARRRAMEQYDTLMIFLLKARRPDKYKDRNQTEMTGQNGGPMTIRVVYGDDGTGADSPVTQTA